MTTVFTGDVMIVEDNVIIAMDAEELVLELGASAVHLATSCATALSILRDTPITAAILDFNLDNETSEAVADALGAAGIPFVFATGYSTSAMLPERYQSHPLLKKPYSGDDIRAMFLHPSVLTLKA